MKRVLTRRILVATFAVGLITAGCASQPAGKPSAAGASGQPTGAFPVSVTAVNGTVRVPARPDAIVSLSPTATEMLYAIGAGSQVKAVDSDSNYPPQAPRTKLSTSTPTSRRSRPSSRTWSSCPTTPPAWRRDCTNSASRC